MNEVRIHKAGRLGRGFVPAQYLPPGQDEYYLRNQQSPVRPWRRLRAEEIEALKRTGNRADDWNSLWVCDPFMPELVRGCQFFGLVRLGRVEDLVLEHHELAVPAGLTDSLLVSCDLGDHVALHNVRYLARYIVGDRVMLLNVDEINCTNHAKFGNGIVKEGEPEEVRIWLDLMNEAGGRSVMPFEGMLPADAYLWAKYRDDAPLVARLGEMTQRQFDARRGFYGTIGDGCVIKNSAILKDVRIGPHCYIKGANKLKNLTILSSPEEPSQIGEGVELVNGIVGAGCAIFYGCKAVRFVIGPNSRLKYGARLIHSFLGDNSTVSCCEILNNLVFPAHEQHHNNSFLAASLVMGQSNLAAGATIGSNHNSRANDGEVQAGRGFWPGLCTTLKHSCRFASYVLLVKGDYPHELDIPFPFALVSDDPAHHRLQVVPAWWWTHNLYALARNAWKFKSRDKRHTKSQKIEFDYLAPDTAEEIFAAMRLLELWTAKADLRARGAAEEADEGLLAGLGKEILMGPDDRTAHLEILGEHLEHSRRKAMILRARRAYHAYRQMLHFYAVKNLVDYFQGNPAATLDSMASALAGPRQRNWVNLGGQLVPQPDLDRLRQDVRSGTLPSWPAIHARYDALWDRYPEDKQRHALATLLAVLEQERLTREAWLAAIDEAARIYEHVAEQVYATRRKDFESPLRRITFRNAEEMRAVLGSPEDNAFVRLVRHESQAFREQLRSLRRRV